MPRVERYSSRGAIVSELASCIEAADHELSLSIPLSVYSEVRQSLARAFDDDVLVMVLLYADDEAPRPVAERFDGVASAVRWSRIRTPVTCTVDQRRGLVAHSGVLVPEGTDADPAQSPSASHRRATGFEDPLLADSIFGYFLGVFWNAATEIHTKERTALPRTFENFRRAVVESTLYLRGDDLLTVRCRAARPDGTGQDRLLEGTVVNARQGVVYPISNSIPFENSLLVQCEDGRVSVGGTGAYLEDFEASEVELVDTI